MNVTRLALLAAVAAATGGYAAAAPAIAPGLWENQVTMKTGSGQMEAAMAQMRERMASMPPEQRQRVEEMMKGRGGGAGMGIASGQPTTVQVCITPEQAAREDLPLHDGRCQVTSKERSGNVVRAKFACTGEHPATGSAEFTLVSDKQTRGTVVVDTVMRGQPEKLQIEQTGRWVGADCGSVKPRGK